MADQLAPSTTSSAAQDPAVTGADGDGDAMLSHQVGGIFTQLPAYHGRPISWVAAVAVVAGFVAGGLGLVFGPTWWLFWAGGALAVVGSLLALVTNMFEDWY
ncbi:MAG: hypothetical protein ABJB47_20495 [Actinomycetota bacterium]